MARGRKKAEPKVNKGAKITKFFSKTETIRSRPKGRVAKVFYAVKNDYYVV